MSLTSERISPAEMKERQKNMIAKAEAVQPTVAVMESNWQAMIASQKEQVNSLLLLLEKMELLATSSQLASFMTQQLEALQKEGKKSSEVLEQHRKALLKEAEDMTEQMEVAAEKMEQSCGSVSEKFGQKLSMEQDLLKRHTKKLFWISMTPSLTLVLLELVRFLLQLT